MARTRAIAELELERARRELERQHDDGEIESLYACTRVPMISCQPDLLERNSPQIASAASSERRVIVGPEDRL